MAEKKVYQLMGMIAALGDLLERKGVCTHQEVEEALDAGSRVGEEEWCLVVCRQPGGESNEP